MVWISFSRILFDPEVGFIAPRRHAPADRLRVRGVAAGIWGIRSMKFAMFVGLVAGVGAMAATWTAQGQTATPVVPAGHYKVEGYHTQVGFSVLHFGITPFSGFFSGASGGLDLDPAKPEAAKLDVSVPVASVLTTVPKLNDVLKSAPWLDAAAFPNATFVSKVVTPTGRDTARIQGDLTLHGVTRPVVLTAKFAGAGMNPLTKAFNLGFTAEGSFKRSEFGLKTYLPMIGDDIHLTIAGAFERQP